MSCRNVFEFHRSESANVPNWNVLESHRQQARVGVYTLHPWLLLCFSWSHSAVRSMCRWLLLSKRVEYELTNHLHRRLSLSPGQRQPEALRFGFLPKSRRPCKLRPVSSGIVLQHRQRPNHRLYTLSMHGWSLLSEWHADQHLFSVSRRHLLGHYAVREC